MKAVILERKGGEAAVLAENGTFMKVRHSGEVGEEIEIAAPVPMMWIKQRWVKGLAAAAIVLAVAGGAYHYSAVSVSAYVSVSTGGDHVEFSLNRLGRVVSVTALGDNSQAVESIKNSTHGMRIEEAVPAALAILEEDGKLSEQEDPVVVGITADSEIRSESLENAIMNSVDVPVRTVIVSDEERRQSHSNEQNSTIYVFEHEETEDDISPAAEEGESQTVITDTTAQETEIYYAAAPKEKAEENTDTVSPSDGSTPKKPEAPDTEPPRDIAQPAADTPQTPGNASDTPVQPIMPEKTQEEVIKPAEETKSSEEQPQIQDKGTAPPQDMPQGEHPSDNGMTPPEQGEHQPGNTPPQDMPQMQDMQPSEQRSPGDMGAPEQQGQNGSAPGAQPPDRAAPPDRQEINAPAGNEKTSEINS
ncbi:MAG: hypothetical protein J6N15_03485 [Ruminiclostridium sp.]|nr:hypothetical protein [Ruminiclostridium sp.]